MVSWEKLQTSTRTVQGTQPSAHSYALHKSERVLATGALGMDAKCASGIGDAAHVDRCSRRPGLVRAVM
eukprot:CAMPEP_0185161608 /NCGR_PEP_ID=MMETSP1139-20130426/5244_1 /TAXON_ID=298111 /ORGANISM="Pavlova sp., Strain CCMP459" /LENGTH=68 /DNA_ID=CAMNT_0027726883 /DNA_START=1062 /DNA_END=1268 /DNA_ORIENTATION=-